MAGDIIADVDLRRTIDMAVDQVTERLAEAVREQTLFIQSVWVSAVSGNLLPGMSRPVHDERYAATISDAASLQYPFDGDPFHGKIVALNGDVALRHEHGVPSFDMKPSLLRGPNSRVAKDGKGRFNTVPFVHTVPGTVGVKGREMPAEIYALAKGLAYGGRLKLPGELAGWGMRSKVPAGVNAEWNRRQSWIGRFLRTPPMTAPYTHKTGHYEGMVRVGRKGHSSYMTFRRVSSNSSPNSWIHPGREPNPILAAVKAYCEPLVVAALEQAARDLDAGGGPAVE